MWTERYKRFKPIGLISGIITLHQTFQILQNPVVDTEMQNSIMGISPFSSSKDRADVTE